MEKEKGLYLDPEEDSGLTDLGADRGGKLSTKLIIRFVVCYGYCCARELSLFLSLHYYAGDGRTDHWDVVVPRCGRVDTHLRCIESY